MLTTIYIVTPCLNAVDSIDRTIMSVASQAGDFRLRYHIQDGGSTDGTLEIIKAWSERFSSGVFPTQNRGITFSWESERDYGMYDAIVRGFDSIPIHDDYFMTWINADDVLLSGSCAFISVVYSQFSRQQVSWVGGAVAIISNDTIIETHDRQLPSEAIREGLCDGQHFPFVQQEGTFFRKWLWDAAKPKEHIARMKLAGDWNLWRVFAHHASLAQASIALGGFRLGANQLSKVQRDKYLREVDELVPPDDRRHKFIEMVERGVSVRRHIKGDFSTGIFSVYEEDISETASSHYKKVFNKAALSQVARKRMPRATKFKGVPSLGDSERIDGAFRNVRHGKGFSIFDYGWQYPAVTEQHAALRIEPVASTQNDCHYVAYPWATLIDKLQAKAKDANLYLEMFERFCERLPRDKVKITVCQHIYAKRFSSLFRQAGIARLYWSHATFEDCNNSGFFEIRPFPLYPVQSSKGGVADLVDNKAERRRHLFSFAGARSNQHYLTKARDWILELLENDSRGLVVGRDGWHYQRIVYDRQIKEDCVHSAAEMLVDSTATEQFRELLKHSTFSLCPSGTGPNSIRLWESIGAGSIPVVLSDSWAPPGNAQLWDLAVVYCKEDRAEIEKLPGRLAKLARDEETMALKRHAMRQLWLLYGPDGFVTDVQRFILAQSKAYVEKNPVQDQGVRLIDDALARRDARALLSRCAGALLLEPTTVLDRMETDLSLVEGIETARTTLPKDSAFVDHFSAVLGFAKAKVARKEPTLFGVSRKAAPKVCLFGKHSNRTPLSYDPIRRLIGPRLEFVSKPSAADVVISGFNIDFRDNYAELAPAVGGLRKPKLAVISEEPLWDITWSGPYTGSNARVRSNGVELEYRFIGHETSEIFEFSRIPYFVLTNDEYAARYASLIRRFDSVTPEQMLERWGMASINAAFFLEKRKDDAYAVNFPSRDVVGLSAYRTEVAEGTEAPGVLRVGRGWAEGMRRQELPDWHLDKLAYLDGRTKILSAFENVHQRRYISEKIFDSFAVGAIPVYFASPQHRVFELIPQASMLNCYGLDSEEAAQRIVSFAPDKDFAEAWLSAAADLASLFRDVDVIQAERLRVAEAALKEIFSIV